LEKKKNKLISFASLSSSSGMKSRKTKKKSNYEDLDKAMLVWFNQQRSQGTPLGLEGNFDVSSGWLMRFNSDVDFVKLVFKGRN
jgi:hypothetical protein